MKLEVIYIFIFHFVYFYSLFIILSLLIKIHYIIKEPTGFITFNKNNKIYNAHLINENDLLKKMLLVENKLIIGVYIELYNKSNDIYKKNKYYLNFL